MSEYGLGDLEPDELSIHAALSSVPPQALPFGFRDTVMRRIYDDRRVSWEWLVAGLLAFPSLAFLTRQIMVSGQDFADAVVNMMSAAASDTGEAFFFVDGLTVLAFALIGIASVFAAHAFIAAAPRGYRVTR